MKIKLSSKKEEGTALLLCLAAAILISLGLATVLYMVISENNLASRSQAWNNSLVNAEAGVEEAMALVNQNFGTTKAVLNWYSTPSGATSPGWTQNGGVFSMTRTIGGGSYSVWVTNNGRSVTIKSTGTTQWTNTSVAPISRSIVTTAAIGGMFQYAVQSKGAVTLSGSATVDAYNSSSPTYSSNGLYVASRSFAGGNMMVGLSNSVSTKILSMSGSAAVRGVVSVGPNDYISSSSSIGIGDTNWAGPGFQPGWTNGNVNVTIPDAPPIPTPPGGAGSWLVLPAMVGGVLTLDGGGPGNTNYYVINSSSAVSSLSGSQKMVVTNGVVVLDVDMTANFQISGSSSIQVAPGSSVVAWWDSSTMSISGSGVVNGSFNATNVCIYGTTNLIAISYSGSSQFIGTIWAPYANVNWSGSAGIYGAVTANAFNDSGGSAIHYDQALLGNASGFYLAGGWNEVSP